MSGVAKQTPPTSARGRGSASGVRGARTAVTGSARTAAVQRQRSSGSPKSGGSGARPETGSSLKAVSGNNKESVNPVMSKSMIATSTTTSSLKPKSGLKPKGGNSSNGSSMTKSFHHQEKATNCHVENGRQDVASAKKVAPKSAPRPKPVTKSMPAKKPEPAPPVVQHSDDEDDDSEDIHPALLKQTRKSGSLNLSGRGLVTIPSKIWTLNEDGNDGKKAIFMEKLDEDNWWERVDLTKLILASNQISKVSPKIKNLMSLQVLDLHDNNISVLPDHIGALENLTKLNLSHNKLSFLPLGFFGMTSLRVLNLCHNELNEIHEDIGNLVMLENLDLAYNKLMELPSAIGCLSKINNFNASHNMLESVPHELSFMRSLMCLELSHNNLKQVGDSAIQDMHCLERLYLQHNQLSTMPTLKNCLHLKEIYLGFNQIVELTDVDLENIPNVKMLDLRENKIPVVPDEIINLQGLERLDISSNELSTLPFCLGTLPHLKSLQVDGNPMRGIRRDIIARGTQGLLKYLRSRIDEDELQRMREKGQVSPIPAISGSPPLVPDKFVMKSAQTMNLTGKDLTFLPKEAVENAIEADVTGVDLSKNHLAEVPQTLEPLLPKLYELNLSSNRLSTIPASMVSLGNHLQFVNLANNKLSQLPIEFGSLVNLREVCLNCNKFDAVPTCLYSCGKLETLMISDNRITAIDVDGLKQLTKLSILDLGNNNVGSVPPELGLLTNLRSLTLDGNAFRVPRPQILVKGTESILAYLRDRIPRNPESGEQS